MLGINGKRILKNNGDLKRTSLGKLGRKDLIIATFSQVDRYWEQQPEGS